MSDELDDEYEVPITSSSANHMFCDLKSQKISLEDIKTKS